MSKAWVPASQRVLFYHVTLMFSTELVIGDTHPWMTAFLPTVLQFPTQTYLIDYHIRFIGSLAKPFPLREVLDCMASFLVLRALKLTLHSMDLHFPGLKPFLDWINNGGVPISMLALFFPHPAGYEDQLEHAAKYIASLGTSLTSLSVGFAQPWYPEIYPPKRFMHRFLNIPFLATNTELQRLTITGACKETHRLLDRMHAPPSLRSLTMGVYPTKDNTYVQLALALDAVLLPLKAMQGLDLVHVEWKNIDDPTRSQDWSSHPTWALPQCQQRVIKVAEGWDLHSHWMTEDNEHKYFRDEYNNQVDCYP
ncbi:hypothetical protein B0H13DRAFT_2365577 [Mycena leptocephala]|nr:hypothetical protein B0H13DRAFT_2365577 [Mycena leptocephala]